MLLPLAGLLNCLNRDLPFLDTKAEPSYGLPSPAEQSRGRLLRVR